MQAIKGLAGLQILALVSLSRESALDMTLLRYVKSSTVFITVPSVEIEEGLVGPGVG